MKKALLVFSILFVTLCNAQKYYPKLENMFLQAGDMDESVFYEEIVFFRDGLRTAIKKVWLNGLQTSSGGNSAFYSLDLVPKWVYEVNFMETGMILKFNHAKEDKVSYIPITCTETIERRSEEKSGEGRIEFLGKGGVALEFPTTMMTPYSTEFKTTIPDAKCLFEPERATYQFDPATKSLTISLTGNFTTGITVGNNVVAATDVRNISIRASKGLLVIGLHYSDKKKGQQTVNLVTKKF